MNVLKFLIMVIFLIDLLLIYLFLLFSQFCFPWHLNMLNFLTKANFLQIIILSKKKAVLIFIIDINLNILTLFPLKCKTTNYGNSNPYSYLILLYPYFKQLIYFYIKNVIIIIYQVYFLQFWHVSHGR